jgi:hypothetical protein
LAIQSRNGLTIIKNQIPDAGKPGRRKRTPSSAAEEGKKLDGAQKKWMSWRNEALWRPVF